MNLVSAQMMVFNLMNKQDGRFFLWTPGWENWALLEEYLKTEQSYFVQIHPPLPFVTSYNGQGSLTSRGEMQEQETEVISESVKSKVEENTEVSEEMEVLEKKPENSNLPPAAADQKRDIEKINAGANIIPLDGIKDSQTSLHTQTDITENGIHEGSFTDVLLEKDLLGAHDFYAPDFQGDDLSLSKIENLKPAQQIESDFGERRNNLRLDLKIEIILMNNLGKSFRSFSRNISISGTLLGDKIPKEFHKSKFDIVVINKFESSPQKNRVALRGNVLGELSDVRRISFETMDEDTKARFTKLLDEYLAEKSKVRKKA